MFLFKQINNTVQLTALVLPQSGASFLYREETHSAKLLNVPVY